MKSTFIYLKASFCLSLVCIPLFCLNAQMQVLHYDETTGFDHNTRNESFALFTALGVAGGYTVVQDSDGSEFTIAKLEDYDLVIFSNTSGNGGLTANQQDALEWYIDIHGGSIMGIHAASDTYRHSSANGGSTGSWDWYAETLGGSVQQNPNHTSQNHVAEMFDLIVHPIIDNISFPWEKEEEYYYWENGYLNNDIVEIFEVEETGDNSYDEPRPMGWYKTKDSGAKIFYTALGHKKGNFTGDFPMFEQLVEDAVLWLIQPTVPVEWGEIKVIKNDRLNSVILKWSTHQEINTDHFELLKSNDLIEWQSVGKVRAAGNSTQITVYFIEDFEPNNSGEYYKIKEVDLDGKASFSQIVHAAGNIGSGIQMYNDMANQRLLLSTESDLGIDKIKIYTADLKMISTFEMLNQSQLIVDINDFETGSYFMMVEGKTKHLKSFNFVKL